jgi:hypothetical protein
VLRLPPHRRLPGDAEPGEVLVDRGLEFRSAPRRVDIFDPQQKPSATLVRLVEVEKRRKRMTEMQIAVR